MQQDLGIRDGGVPGTVAAEPPGKTCHLWCGDGPSMPTLLGNSGFQQNPASLHTKNILLLSISGCVSGIPARSHVIFGSEAVWSRQGASCLHPFAGYRGVHVFP